MHSRQAQQAPELLTAQQVQLMLGVDRSTVYRMADDGRLPAVKVGRQWRFPADRVRGLLVVDPLPTAPSRVAGSPGGRRRGALVIDPDVATSVAQVAAELLGVMMVVTDMDGRPLTPVGNPCPWFAARSDDPTLLEACIAEWQQLADDPHFEPRLAVGALGFECARAFVRVGTSLAGMVLVGGVAPAGTDVEGLYELDDAQRRRVLSGLLKVAAALSQVEARGTERRSTP